jgi:hypothetical protein
MKLILITYFFSFIFSKPESSINSDTHDLRILYVHSSYKKSIYYTPGFDKFNNFTGTGNMLKDEAYRAICMSLNCQSGCCDDDTNIMTCGYHDDCVKYENYVVAWRIAVIVLITFAVLFIISFSIIRGCNKQRPILEILGLAFLTVLGIALLPITLIVLLIYFCRKGSGNDKGSAKVR